MKKLFIFLLMILIAIQGFRYRDTILYICHGFKEVFQETLDSVRQSEEEKLSYIEEHEEEYTEDLLELLEKNPETLDYVYNYPWEGNREHSYSLDQEARADKIPLLLQWDNRWGYDSYGSGLIGYTGCGPTCLSMVALYLTDRAEYTPEYVANLAESEGYWVEGKGSSWELMSKGCEYLGIYSFEIAKNEQEIREHLDMGYPVICSVGPGDFTLKGHFIVLTGYKDGYFTLNDPNSKLRSEREWTFEELSGQIKNLWAFYCYE